MNSARPHSLPAVSRDRNFSAYLTLFVLTLQQLIRGRRWLLVAVLFLLPCGVTILARSVNPIPRYYEMELGLVFAFIPNVLAPLTALLYASGMIQDEIEEQTLTYLLVRPLPRWAIYTTKLLATYLLTVVLVGFFTAVTLITIYVGTPGFWGDIFPVRMFQATILLSVALAGYCALFGFISLWTNRSLVVGVLYILIFEGMLANMEFAIRQITVIFYFRVLSMRWLDLKQPPWSLDLNTAPSAGTCVLVLVLASAVFTWLAGRLFSNWEFRVKTPEAS